MQTKNAPMSVGLVSDAMRAVVRVGEGRGFVVDALSEWEPGRFARDRFIITAAHCLPNLPPIYPDRADYTYKFLVGRLSDTEMETRVSAECVFADARSDIAVLCGPDDQAMYSEANRYAEVVEDERILPIVVSDALSEGRAWLLSLDGRRFGCTVRHQEPSLWLFDAEEPIEGGMSGSPIFAADGTAIGLISEAFGTDSDGEDDREGRSPVIMRTLPGWLSRRLLAAKQCGQGTIASAPIALEALHAGDS